MAYTEKTETSVNITNDGTKEVRTVTIVLKDGEEIGRSNHRSTVAYDAAVPANVSAHIMAKKGKQPTRPNND